MNFQRTNTKISLLEDYYSHFNEDHRLKTRHGIVEYKTNMKYIEELLNKNKINQILDIGAGTGNYSIPLSEMGYEVHALELVNHNIEIFKSKNSNVTINQGNALDLSIYPNEYFDMTLLFGPMYHLLTNQEKIQALSEAKRVTKKNGFILVSYYMNEYAILSYGFIKQKIKECIKNNQLNEDFHMLNKENDLYSMSRIEDIDNYRNSLDLKRYKIIASDGASDYIRTTLNKLDEEEFELYIKYHQSICERKELLGASSHVLDILIK